MFSSSWQFQSDPILDNTELMNKWSNLAKLQITEMQVIHHTFTTPSLRLVECYDLFKYAPFFQASRPALIAHSSSTEKTETWYTSALAYLRIKYFIS